MRVPALSNETASNIHNNQQQQQQQQQQQRQQVFIGFHVFYSSIYQSYTFVARNIERCSNIQCQCRGIQTPSLSLLRALVKR